MNGNLGQAQRKQNTQTRLVWTFNENKSANQPVKCNTNFGLKKKKKGEEKKKDV